VIEEIERTRCPNEVILEFCAHCTLSCESQLRRRNRSSHSYVLAGQRTTETIMRPGHAGSWSIHTGMPSQHAIMPQSKVRKLAGPFGGPIRPGPKTGFSSPIFTQDILFFKAGCATRRKANCGSGGGCRTHPIASTRLKSGAAERTYAENLPPMRMVVLASERQAGRYPIRSCPR